MHRNTLTAKLSTVASGEYYAGILRISVCAISSYSIWNNSSCDTKPPMVVVLNGHVQAGRTRVFGSDMEGFGPDHMTIDLDMFNIWLRYKAEYSRRGPIP